MAKNNRKLEKATRLVQGQSSRAGTEKGRFVWIYNWLLAQ